VRFALSALLALGIVAIACDGGINVDERGLATECNPESNAPARAEGDTFITDSGVDVVVLAQAPESNRAQANDEIAVHFKGSLADGTQFGDSQEQLGEPFTFAINTEGVICGWVEGVVGMSPGEVRELTIPPELAYGNGGFGELIPADATVVFEIEMIGFAEPEPTRVAP